jgi:hypothetical protein
LTGLIRPEATALGVDAEFGPGGMPRETRSVAVTDVAEALQQAARVPNHLDRSAAAGLPHLIREKYSVARYIDRLATALQGIVLRSP